MRSKTANYKSHWNILVFYDQWKITSDLNKSLGKMSDFVSFPWFGFILVIKLRNFNFESHWGTLICPDEKSVRFEYVPWKNFWFCFIFIFLFFSHRIEQISSNWNTSIYFDKKRYSVTFEYVPWKNVWLCFISIVWVHFSHKTENFNICWYKTDVRFDYVLSRNVWFGLSFIVCAKFWQ